MAVTHHKSSRTIRGIKYDYGDTFKCYASYGGTGNSEGGGGTASDLTVGTTYYYLGYAIDDDTGGLTSYPYAVGTTSSGVHGWFKENVFPYAKYTITYNANGGTFSTKTQTKTHGTDITIPSASPTRTGYTFKGWCVPDRTDVDSKYHTEPYYQPSGTIAYNGDQTLKAVWAENTLTVNYYSNYATSAFDGAENTVGSDKNVKVGHSTIYYDNDYSTYGLANYSGSGGSMYMTRTGYTATGKWGTSPSGGTLVDEDTTFATGQAIAKALGKDISQESTSINVYAQWDANSYTYNIVYKSSSGTQLGTATVSKDYGTTNTVSPKSFTGYTSPSSQSIKWDSTSAKTITFTYTPISYDVTINCNGGSGVNSRTYTIETATFTLGTPTRTGYTFNGWTGSNGDTAQKTVSISKSSTGDKSYTAQWEEHKLTVNYYSNKADYGTFEGNALNVSASTNVLVYSQEFLYDNKYDNGLSDVQNKSYLYLSRIGYKPTGYWKVVDNEISVNQSTPFATGQDLAVALGETIVNGNVSVDVYPQWKPAGIVYIDNGTKLEAYLPYIDNGTSWDLYLAYVDNGADWEIIS